MDMMATGLSIQMPRIESLIDEGGAANNSLLNDEQKLKKRDDEMTNSRYEDSINAVATRIFFEEQSFCSNELSSKKEEFAPVPNPNNALSPEEEAQGSELSSTKEQTPGPIKMLTEKVIPPVKSSYTLLKHKDKLAAKKFEFKRSFSKKSEAESEDSQKSEVPQSNKLKSFRSKSQSLGKKSEDPRLELLRLQRMRCETGLWVQCVSCNKWRYLASISDPQHVPQKWQCSMSSDPNFASCSIEQVGPSPEEELHMVHAPYSVGSLVWARMTGFPWWPAMVDDDPDFEQYYWLNDYSDIPTYYNVVFFDSEPVTRAWISPDSLKPFIGKEQDKELCTTSGYGKDYKKRMAVAVRDTERASSLNVPQRLQEFSFIARYMGKVGNKRKKTRKQNKSSKKHSKQQRCEESSLCSEDSYELRKAQMLSLSQADDVKVDVTTANQKKKKYVDYSSQSSSSYSSSSTSPEESSVLSNSYSSDDCNKVETCENSSSSTSSNSTLHPKKNKPMLTKKSHKVKSPDKKDHLKKEKKFKQPSIKKSFAVKNKTNFCKKSIISDEGTRNAENKQTASKTQKTIVKEKNDSSSVIMPNKELSVAEQTPSKEEKSKTNKLVKPKFNLFNFVKAAKKTDKKAQTNVKSNNKISKIKETTEFKAKKESIKNKTEDSGDSATNYKESSDTNSPNSPPNTIVNENNATLFTEVKLVNSCNDSSGVPSCEKSDEKKTNVISDKQPDANCSQSGLVSKPKKRKLPQFMVPTSKKRVTNTNFESENTTTSARTNIQVEKVLLQEEKTFKTDMKDNKTCTKTELNVDTISEKKHNMSAELAKKGTESRSKVVAQLESITVEKQQEQQVTELVENDSETNCNDVIREENVSLGREKVFELAKKDNKTGANEEQSSLLGNYCDIETSVQDNKVEESSVSGEASQALELQSEINETLEMPGTSEVNTETPDCSGVIDEVLTNFSDENMEFFNPSSPLFDMEE